MVVGEYFNEGDGNEIGEFGLDFVLQEDIMCENGECLDIQIISV